MLVAVKFATIQSSIGSSGYLKSMHATVESGIGEDEAGGGRMGRGEGLNLPLNQGHGITDFLASKQAIRGSFVND